MVALGLWKMKTTPTLFSSFIFIHLNLNPQSHVYTFWNNPSWPLEGFVFRLCYFGIYCFLVCSCMNAKRGATRRIKIFGPCCIPFYSFCSTACHTRASWNCWPGSTLLKWNGSSIVKWFGMIEICKQVHVQKLVKFLMKMYIFF